MLVGSNAAVNLSQAAADDQAMLLRVNRRFANGLMIDVNYTWSKNIDKTDTVEDNQGFNAGGGARGASHYLSDFTRTAASATATCGAGTTATRASRCRADA